VLRADGIGNTALHFHTHDERVEKIGAGKAAVFRKREQSRRHGSGWMDDRAPIGIVEVEDMRTDAVHQRGVEHVEAFLAPEDGCLLRTAERL
jgi:limonene-1,2-epoxide hydrolase